MPKGPIEYIYWIRIQNSDADLVKVWDFVVGTYAAGHSILLVKCRETFRWYVHACLQGCESIWFRMDPHQMMGPDPESRETKNNPQ